MFRWFQKVPYPELPLRDYWVQIEVRLEPPLAVSDGTQVVGYFRLFGLRAVPGAVSSAIAERVTDGEILSFESHEVDIRVMDRRVTKSLYGLAGCGVWHESGRAFFASWDTEERT